jgi:uncharacterized protein (DUF433 family)
MRDDGLIGRGVYGIGDAARLAQIPRQRVARWATGLVRARRVEAHALALNFLDLMELRAVEQFRRAGVSLQAIRRAHERASEVVGHEHPFSTRTFKTDGRTILMELAKEQARREAALLDLLRQQLVFGRILEPYLRGVEFGREKLPVRWWPLDRAGGIVLDPERCFGQPIVAREGIPAAVLAATARAEGGDAASIRRAAHWYGVPPAAVRSALRFEESLAA